MPHCILLQLLDCLPIVAAGIEAGDLVAVSVGLELPGSDRYEFTRGTVLGSGGWVGLCVCVECA